MKQHPNMQTTLNFSLNSLQHKQEKPITSESLSQQNRSQEIHGQTSTNFNTANTAKGAAYEKLVQDDLLTRGYTDIIPGIWPTSTQTHPTKIYARGQRVCSVDFYAKNSEGTVEYIEAKGGCTNKKNKQLKVTAGAMRCDSVKKALWNGWEIKNNVPNSRYVIYFSQEPRLGSPADMMIQDALEKSIVDEVRYLPFYETTD